MDETGTGPEIEALVFSSTAFVMIVVCIDLSAVVTLNASDDNFQSSTQLLRESVPEPPQRMTHRDVRPGVTKTMREPAIISFETSGDT